MQVFLFFLLLISGIGQVTALFRLVDVLRKHYPRDLQKMQERATFHKGAHYAALNIMLWSKGALNDGGGYAKSILLVARLLSFVYVTVFVFFVLSVTGKI